MSTLLFILVTIIQLGGNPFIEECQVYPMSATVVDIYENYNCVEFEDKNGNTWLWDDIEDWEIGDNVALIMYNNMTTDSIYDDVILTIKYEGWSE